MLQTRVKILENKPDAAIDLELFDKRLLRLEERMDTLEERMDDLQESIKELEEKVELRFGLIEKYLFHIMDCLKAIADHTQVKLPPFDQN